MKRPHRNPSPAQSHAEATAIDSRSPSIAPRSILPVSVEAPDAQTGDGADTDVPVTPIATASCEVTARRARLSTFERQWHQGVKAFGVGVEALRTIRDERLYRDDFDTFEAYCQARLGKSRRHIDRHLRCEVLLPVLGPIGLTLANESQGRAFLDVPEPHRPEVMRRVTSEPRLTAKVIRKVAAEVEREHQQASRSPDLPSTSPTEDSAEAVAPERDADVPPVVTKDGNEKLLVAVPHGLFPGATAVPPRNELAPVWKDLVPAWWLVERRPDLDPYTDEGVEALIELWRATGRRGRFNPTNDSIGWADWSWNPVTGCCHACAFCYAEEMARRRYIQGFQPTFHPDRMLIPAQMRVPEAEGASRRVFCGSMADNFGGWVPSSVVKAILRVQGENPAFQFMNLTKHPNGLVGHTFPDNAWVGASVINQAGARAAERAMAQVEARIRWASCEPLLASVVFERPELFNLVVVGAQTAANGQPAFQPQWAWVESLLFQAHGAGARFYLKTNVECRPMEMPE